MPIYEYRCLRCEKVSEFFLRVSDPHPESCPRCGDVGSLRKQISQTSFSLKGEGWYVTDYKKPAGAPSKEGDSEGAKGGDKATTESGSLSTEVDGGGSAGAPAAAPVAVKTDSASNSGKSVSGKDSSSSGGTKGNGPSGS